MQSILTRIPDPEVFLALPTEELAFTLLLLADEYRQNNIVHPQAIIGQIDGVPGSDYGYPQAKKAEVELAFAEAWNWLTVQGLLIKDVGPNGNNGFVRLSRQAKSLLSSERFIDYSKGVSFPKSLLHPSISQDVWIDLSRGDYETAVFKAFRMVEIAVREAAKFDDKDIGTSLMRKAFDKNAGPLTSQEDPESERDALAHLFAGAIGVYKNPQSHRMHEIKGIAEAQEMVMIASHLLRIVESRTPQVI